MSRAVSRILLVEDDPDDLEVFRRCLGTVDVNTDLTTASTGEEALRLLVNGGPPESGSPFEAVFIDVRLSGMNGIELLKRIKAQPGIREVCVIMLTGSDDDDTVRVCQEFDAHSHLVKPINGQDLAWMVASIQRSQKTLRRLNEFSEFAR